jgi:hypothetical protein
MEGKVKCSGCGWSWNKSDSSKKDMYVCHQCGKDNTMKNGGWLNKYDDGGSVQPNYNDASVSMSDDFVGLGYDTKGRNYSPAWGGQFEEGGIIPSAQTGKFVPSSLTQQVQQAVQPTVKPTATVPYLQTKDPSEFYKSWIQSPEYARRQLLTGYSSGEDLYMPNAEKSRNIRLSAIEEMTPITYSTREASKADPGIYGSPSYVNINPSDYTGTSKQAIEAHELAHIAGAMGNRGTGTREGGMSNREQEIFQESMLPMAEPKLSGAQGSKEREASKRALEDFQHSQKPDEVKADLDALRFMMYDKGIYDITKGNKFTESDFEKSKQSLGKDRVFNRLEKRVGKKNFVNLMNTIASTDNQEEVPIAMGGMSIPGSVGFTYARTAGSAPSKGKYAKKTMASAQIGKKIEKDETNIDTNIANKIAGLELKQNPEYQYFKYLQSLPQLKQAPGRGEELMRQGLGYADVATDVMQMGNFIPHPGAQAIGKVGNIAGSIIDGLQGIDEAYRGNYLNAGINATSAILPSLLGASTFRRNTMKLRPGDPLYLLTEQARRAANSPINLNKTDTGYLELFSNVKGMTNNSLLWNRGLLGALGAETAYDVMSQTSSPNVISSSDIEGVYPKSQPLPAKTESMSTAATAKKLADYINSKSGEKTGEAYGRKSYYPIDGFKDGGEIPSAQNGIMSPMLLARNVLNYFYPNEENTNTVEAAPANYKKGLTNELLQRQAYKESTFNPAAVSPAGYKGLTQIGEGVLQDYSNKKGGKKLDPFNPKDAVELQKFAMGDLYNASFINKPEQSDSVRIAKTLAAYNWGRGNLANYLNEQKDKGVDIYGSYDWLNDLPKETSDYVNKILLQEDPSFNKNYKKASTNPKYEEVTSLYDQKKFGGDIPSAQNGQEMKFYQNGLDWKPRSMQDGGITKDNQGYWNPDNWGKPVEIDSNDITMEGVYEPLLGVSDTGDTKLMKPGKNYKFKGKKVTEYPVAKLGINQLDAQPMKKLNQLLNFTNNPDKNNWLDKYN